MMTQIESLFVAMGMFGLLSLYIAYLQAMTLKELRGWRTRASNDCIAYCEVYHRRAFVLSALIGTALTVPSVIVLIFLSMK